MTIEFNGPNCNKILEDNVLQQLADFLPQEEEFQQYVVTLKAMRGLKKSCFSSHKLDTSIGVTVCILWVQMERTSSKIYWCILRVELGEIPRVPHSWKTCTGIYQLARTWPWKVQRGILLVETMIDKRNQVLFSATLWGPS